MLLRGERLGRPRRCPTEIYDIMKECWHISPHNRPTFAILSACMEKVR